ncbi:enoyl-CoA hydratase domain-containing protein 2, mitochondrial isoform X1 [Panthera uncia]|uniref:enoyl-CoA hydratase domain-containing protein 2, mitochondrial isoform X1 n=1 Tax=Panthera uncia TaxID=29064 RepID=UPI0020FFE5DA|nr:enoyl-CoA hydratase domain-containing protein 2, mitochondrial isoform X1 [Panthera uncia]
MLRALTSALRLPRPWRPLQTRSCASDGAAGDPEIQVRALAGPDQGITEILMNRPSARNALGNVLVSELLEALARLREDQQVRVLLFRSGVKGVFCAGADLKEREQMSEAEVGIFVQRLRGLMNEIAAFPAPTIAAMDGFALGGGLELALACDLRVAGTGQKKRWDRVRREEVKQGKSGDSAKLATALSFPINSKIKCNVRDTEQVWGKLVSLLAQPLTAIVPFTLQNQPPSPQECFYQPHSSWREDNQQKRREGRLRKRLIVQLSGSMQARFICHVLHKEPWGQFVTSPVNHKHAWAETLPSGSLVPGKCCNTCSERLSLKSGGRG